VRLAIPKNLRLIGGGGGGPGGVCGTGFGFLSGVCVGFGMSIGAPARKMFRPFPSYRTSRAESSRSRRRVGSRGLIIDRLAAAIGAGAAVAGAAPPPLLDGSTQYPTLSNAPIERMIAAHVSNLFSVPSFTYAAFLKKVCNCTSTRSWLESLPLSPIATFSTT
jgi:hypothetical protein